MSDTCTPMFTVGRLSATVVWSKLIESEVEGTTSIWHIHMVDTRQLWCTKMDGTRGQCIEQNEPDTERDEDCMLILSYVDSRR